MSERETYPAGVPCWVDTMHPDPGPAIDFYGGVFGWEFDGPGPMPDPEGGYFVARLNGRDVAGIGFLPAGAPAPAAWTTYVSVEHAEDTVRLARELGAGVVVEPFDAAPAGRGAVLSDPAGAVFGIWEPGSRHGAQLINVPSAWAMSLLQTPDPDAATAFYGELFGWQPEPFGEGISLFRLPGYVGGEPEQPVPRDVVAAMAAASVDGPGAAWSVDFWIADTDGAATQAAGLGGRVVVEPHDAPMFRRAVLADPAGAAFSISELVLPPNLP